MEITEVKIFIKDSPDKKVEIIDFLNQNGNYGVGKNTINNILSEKRFNNRTFAEKIVENSGSSNSKTI